MGHWLRWMPTGKNNGSMCKNTHSSSWVRRYISILYSTATYHYSSSSSSAQVFHHLGFLVCREGFFGSIILFRVYIDAQKWCFLVAGGAYSPPGTPPQGFLGRGVRGAGVGG